MDPTVIATLASWYVSMTSAEPDTEEFYQFSLLIDQWSHELRIGVRTKLESWNCPHLMRNLYYDYAKQCWI